MVKCAILALASCLCLAAQQASLDGTTVNAVTQAPLAGVHVSLVSVGAVSALPGPDDAYGAISDAAGHYSIHNIRPGDYRLSSRLAGFVFVNAKASLTLAPGEQNSAFKIAMAPEATIAGRVVDEFGDPVQNVSVRAIPAKASPPGGVGNMRAETDDRGEYRLSGLPGSWYVEASARPGDAGGPAEIRTDGSLTTPYATTFYPGALAKERARVVEVAAGQELPGIDIHIARRKNLKITGVVRDAKGAPIRANVSIFVRHDNAEGEESVMSAADGSFEFANLAPSEYRLQASEPILLPGDQPLSSPLVAVTIEQDDARVDLSVGPGQEMKGTLRIEGNGPAKPGEHWTVRLTPADPRGIPTTGGQIAGDGAFTIGGIFPGVYLPTIDPLPENAYIHSLQVDGVETGDGRLDLSKGAAGSSMKIVVRRDGGQISGSVAAKDSQTFAGKGLVVILAGDPASFATWRSAFSSDSTYTIHGIRPGKYRLFAVAPAQFAGGYEPLKAIAARAGQIEVKAGDRIVKDLIVTEKESAGAK